MCCHVGVRGQLSPHVNFVRSVQWQHKPGLSSISEPGLNTTFLLLSSYSFCVFYFYFLQISRMSWSFRVQFPSRGIGRGGRASSSSRVGWWLRSVGWGRSATHPASLEVQAIVSGSRRTRRNCCRRYVMDKYTPKHKTTTWKWCDSLRHVESSCLLSNRTWRTSTNGAWISSEWPSTPTTDRWHASCTPSFRSVPLHQVGKYAWHILIHTPKAIEGSVCSMVSVSVNTGTTARGTLAAIFDF